MHRLLKRQIKRILGEGFEFDEKTESLIKAIDQAYQQFDDDREMLERSLDLSSKELLKANANLRDIFSAIPDQFFRIDKAGKIIDCKGNDPSEFILPPNELIGKKIYEIPNKKVSAKFKDAIDLFHVSSDPLLFEYDLEIKDKHEYFEARFFQLSERQLVVVIRNITKRKIAQNALQESEERYRTFIDSVPNFVTLKDTKGKYLSANKAFMEFIGVDNKEDVIGKTDNEIFSQEIAEFCEECDQILLNDLRVHKVETKLGEEYFEVIKFPVRLRDDKLAIGSFISNITERKKAEENLAKQRHLTDRILEIIPDKIYFKNLNSEFLAVSKSYLDFLNLNSEEAILGKTDFDIFNPEHARDAYNDEQEIIQFGKPVYNKEEEEIIGSKRTWVLTSKLPLIDPNGNVYGTMGISKDITSLKNTSEELRVAKEKAEESNRLKTSFLNNMSHEIRTPLNVIQGYANLLKEEFGNIEDIEEYLKPILRNSNSLLKIIEDILDISVIETGQVQLKYERANIIGVIRDIIAELRFSAYQKGLFLEFKNEMDAAQMEVNIDINKLRQVLTNFIVNSIKYTHEGSITVSIKKINNNIRFLIKDTGIGIEEKYHKVIFERFQRIDTSPDDRYQSVTEGGTGLGLPICKGFIELMGGRVWIESELGKGTSIFFTIPI